MVTKRTSKIARIGKSIHGYEMNGGKFNLIVARTKKWATNLDYLPEKLTKIYKRRWRIETGYKKKKDFKIRTRTRNAVIRALFFFVEILMYNEWILARNLPSKIIEICGDAVKLTTRIFKQKFLGIP